jgi:hypothetical protein
MHEAIECCRAALPVVNSFMSVIRGRLQTAVQLHGEGRLHEAETLYREVLAVAPEQPDALHL